MLAIWYSHLKITKVIRIPPFFHLSSSFKSLNLWLQNYGEKQQLIFMLLDAGTVSQFSKYHTHQALREVRVNKSGPTNKWSNYVPFRNSFIFSTSAESCSAGNGCSNIQRFQESSVAHWCGKCCIFRHMSFQNLISNSGILFFSNANFLHKWFKFSYLYFHFKSFIFGWHMYIKHLKTLACVLKTFLVLTQPTARSHDSSQDAVLVIIQHPHA